MRTIFITIPWFSPAFQAGGPVQSIANMVSELDTGYEFFIYTSNTDLNGLVIAIPKTNEWVEYNKHTKVWYADKQGRSQHLVEEVEKIQPDVLYIIGMFSWHYTIVPLFYGKASDKLISVRGMLHPGALAQKAMKKKIFLQILGRMRIVGRCRFQATDEAEADHIQRIFGKEAVVQVAGNFPRIMDTKEPAEKKAGQLNLVSVGLISQMKNYLLVLQALGQVSASVEYHIYGPVKDLHYWEQCLAVIRNLPGHIQVTYNKELLPQKLAAKLRANHVFILPSESENFGHAIFEALSAGLPVITSRDTPWNGLAEATAGMNVETNKEAISTAINFFAEMGEQEYRVFSNSAAHYARQKYDRIQLVTQYENLFNEVKENFIHPATVL
jgi:glycosyltransferase involved in cell wall biosynthesis